MSRSYKKYLFYKDVKSSKLGKRKCNKKIRNTENIPNGKSYKKITSKWDYIYDYSCSETWKEYQEYYRQLNWYNTKKESNYIEWYKVYKMK